MKSSFIKPWSVYIVAQMGINSTYYFQPGYDHTTATDTR